MNFCAVLVFCLILGCSAYPSGAPDGLCATLMPRHSGAVAQDSPSPFKILVSKVSIKGGEVIDIEIRSDEGRSFKGFYLLARTVEGVGEHLGEFLLDENEPSNSKHRQCGSGFNNAVTHTDREMKEKIVFKWISPKTFEGKIHFVATVVEEKSVFWMNQESQTVSITQTENDVYTDCFKTKSCFGFPQGCIDEKNCDSFSSVIVKDGVFTFEMQSSGRAAYIATALSDDPIMGLDSAIECVNENGAVSAYTSMTRAIPNNYGARRSDDQSIIRLKDYTLQNGKIYCLVERDAVSEVDGIGFDLISHGYHLLMASGSTAAELSIGYHDINRGASSRSILFTEDNPVRIRLYKDQPSKTLILIHGSFMIAAWIGCTSIGVFSARYMKKLWSGKQVFGKDLWFVVHQVSMLFTWALTISAVIIIWIDVGEWRTSTHSLLGIIAATLCLIQPLGGLFRPAPDANFRPIFNFMHGSIGKLAHIIAVVTIFFATSMARADLPSWIKYILIAYIGVYLIFYAALTNLSLVSDAKEKELNGSLKEAQRQGSKEGSTLLTLRRAIFIVFTVFVIGFVIIFISAVTLRSSDE